MTRIQTVSLYIKKHMIFIKTLQKMLKQDLTYKLLVEQTSTKRKKTRKSLV